MKKTHKQGQALTLKRLDAAEAKSIEMVCDAGMAPSSVNQRLSAIRRLATEAEDNGLLDPQVANGIRAVKGARREGRRTGNWLTRDEAQQWLDAPDTRTLKGKRDRALLAVLIG